MLYWLTLYASKWERLDILCNIFGLEFNTLEKNSTGEICPKCLIWKDFASDICDDDLLFSGGTFYQTGISAAP